MKKQKPKLVLTILIFSIILLISAQNALSVDNTLDMELSFSVSGVNSLLEFNDKLYAGTSGYLHPGSGEIYVYDGTEWNLDLVVPNAIQVHSLCEYQNKLYAGTGTWEGKIYVYDPELLLLNTEPWDLALNPPAFSIRGLCVYNGKLYASMSPYPGNMGYIFAYDGKNWEYVISLPYFWLGGFAEYEGKLYLGVGLPLDGSGPSGAIYVYDGNTWEISWSSTSIHEIISFTVYDGKMYAAGWGFDAISNTREGEILVYDGNWNTVFESDQDFYTLQVHGNKLYAGGGRHIYPERPSAKLYSFDGNSWEIAYDFTSYDEQFTWSMCSYRNSLYVGATSGIYVSKEMIISAIVDLDPDTFNLKSKGKWVTVYLELPNGYDVADIDISTLLLQDTIHAELTPTNIGDYDADGIPDLMVKFDRESLQSSVSVGDSVEIFIEGSLTDGTLFTGTDCIRVIDQSIEYVDELPPPIKEEPLDGEILNTRTIDFKWEKVEQAVGYLIIIDDDPLFGSYDYYYIPGGNTVSWSYTFLQDDTYYWSMSTVNSEGVWGDWSTSWSFIIDTSN